MKPFRAIIGVMGPGETATESETATAFQLGKQLAIHNFCVLCGGRSAGVMNAVASGVASENGCSIGILPGNNKNMLSQHITIPIVTGMGNGRNAINVLSSDIIIALGYTPGTVSEIMLAVKCNKDIILLEQSQASTQFFREINYNRLTFAASIEEALSMIENWVTKKLL